MIRIQNEHYLEGCQVDDSETIVYLAFDMTSGAQPTPWAIECVGYDEPVDSINVYEVDLNDLTYTGRSIESINKDALYIASLLANPSDRDMFADWRAAPSVPDDIAFVLSGDCNYGTLFVRNSMQGEWLKIRLPHAHAGDPGGFHRGVDEAEVARALNSLVGRKLVVA